MSPAAPGRDVSHLPQQQSSFRGEAKKFKASGSGDPSHKSRWMLAPNIQQIWSPGELSFANRPSRVLNTASTTVHKPVWLPIGCCPFFPAVQQHTTNSSGWRSLVEIQAHIPWDAAFTPQLFVASLVLALWVHRRRRNHSAKDNPRLWLCPTAWHRTAVNLVWYLARPDLLLICGIRVTESHRRLLANLSLLMKNDILPLPPSAAPAKPHGRTKGSASAKGSLPSCPNLSDVKEAGSPWWYQVLVSTL